MGPCLQPELLACKQSFQSQHPSPLFSPPPPCTRTATETICKLFAIALGANTRFRRVPQRAEGCWGARALLGWRRSAHTEHKHTRRLKTILILRSKRVRGRRERRVQERARCVSLLFNEPPRWQELSGRRTLHPEPRQGCGGAVQGSCKRCRAGGAAHPAEETKAAALIQATFVGCRGCESSKLPGAPGSGFAGPAGADSAGSPQSPCRSTVTPNGCQRQPPARVTPFC